MGGGVNGDYVEKKQDEQATHFQASLQQLVTVLTPIAQTLAPSLTLTTFPTAPALALAANPANSQQMDHSQELQQGQAMAAASVGPSQQTPAGEAHVAIEPPQSPTEPAPSSHYGPPPSAPPPPPAGSFDAAATRQNSTLMGMEAVFSNRGRRQDMADPGDLEMNHSEGEYEDLNAIHEPDLALPRSKRTRNKFSKPPHR